MTTAEHNPTPSPANMRATLRRFVTRAERSSDPVECHLYNAGYIAPLRTRTAHNRTHGKYARRYWRITTSGTAYLNGECRALVPYQAAAPQFARTFLLGVWWSYYRDPELEALIEEMSLKKVEACPF